MKNKKDKTSFVNEIEQFEQKPKKKLKDDFVVNLDEILYDKKINKAKLKKQKPKRWKKTPLKEDKSKPIYTQKYKELRKMLWADAGINTNKSYHRATRINYDAIDINRYGISFNDNVLVNGIAIINLLHMGYFSQIRNKMFRWKGIDIGIPQQFMEWGLDNGWIISEQKDDINVRRAIYEIVEKRILHWRQIDKGSRN